jgi:hypothetical protein
MCSNKMLLPDSLTGQPYFLVVALSPVTLYTSTTPSVHTHEVATNLAQKTYCTHLVPVATSCAATKCCCPTALLDSLMFLIVALSPVTLYTSITPSVHTHEVATNLAPKIASHFQNPIVNVSLFHLRLTFYLQYGYYLIFR